MMFLLTADGDEAEGGGEKKKRQTRGGRGVIKTKQKQDVEKHIALSRSCRGKKKYTTIVTGLSTYGTSHNSFNCHCFGRVIFR